MSLSTFSIRMDENLKSQFETLCNDFGMNMSTAINVFARAVVREQKIPFEIASNSKQFAKEGRDAFNFLREQAKANKIQDMPLDEINEEINNARV